MPTNFTENYQLSQWEAADPVLREDFNADNLKIDAALKKHTAQLAQRGNCVISAYSYTGDGSSGHTTTFSFSHKPILILITGGEYLITILHGAPTAQCRDGVGNCYQFPLTWGSHRLQWAVTPEHVTQEGNGDGIEYQIMTLSDIYL